MNWEHRLDEKRRDIVRKRLEKQQNASERLLRDKGREYSRNREIKRSEGYNDLIQPIGKDRDRFYKKYGYLPDFHGLPGDADHNKLKDNEKKYI